MASGERAGLQPGETLARESLIFLAKKSSAGAGRWLLGEKTESRRCLLPGRPTLSINYIIANSQDLSSVLNCMFISDRH